MPSPTPPPIDVAGLLTYLTTWMYPLIPTAGALMVSYHAVMKAVSTDDVAAAQHGRSIKTVLMYTAIALGGNGLVNLLTAILIPASTP